MSSISYIPPVVIVHLVRHAQSAKGDEQNTNALSFHGQMQCDDLSQSFTKFSPYVSQILSYHFGRCLETARKGFSRHLRSGLKIQVMPALAGSRGDGFSSSTATRHPEVDDVWIEERPATRNLRTSPDDFAMQFLKLEDLSIVEADISGEIVIVTHGQQLSTLLGKDYRGSDFPNAKLRSYVVHTGDNSKSLVYLANEEALKTQRAQNQAWWNIRIEASFQQSREERYLSRKEAEEIAEQAKFGGPPGPLATAAKVKAILSRQDHIQVVDVVTKQIMPLKDLLVLLKARHREEFRLEQQAIPLWITKKAQK